MDVVLSEGEAVYAEVTHDIMDICLTNEDPLLEDDTGILPYLREAGSQMPSDYPLEKQAEIIDFAITVLHALEFTDGTFHVELKYNFERCKEFVILTK